MLLGVSTVLHFIVPAWAAGELAGIIRQMIAVVNARTSPNLKLFWFKSFTFPNMQL
jgi:hypothetical protein